MKICVVGGGAAGMMAAYFCSLNIDTEVFIIEKNEKLGKKMYISGKGRCNLTNNCTYDEFEKNIISNPKFLISALRSFSPQDTMSLFEEHGLALKTERGNRVFPLSDKSGDVLKTLRQMLEKNGVKLFFNENVRGFSYKNNRIEKVVTDKNTYLADKVILATGGMSYPLTGSTGDGYTFSKEMGHTVIEPVSALCAVEIKTVHNAFGAEIELCNMPSLQGLSLKNVTAEIVGSSNKTLFSEFGEMLFTDDGVSGPLILTISSRINRKNLSDLTLKIDLKPAISDKVFDDRLIREFSANTNKQLKNVLREVLPSSLIEFIIKLSGISGEKAVNSVSKEERARLVRLIKGLTFKMKKLADIKEAIITAGGVSTKEINPKNMQSRLVENLYFAGEIIDVDALTGGFNLQIAFSTAFLAAKGIAEGK